MSNQGLTRAAYCIQETNNSIQARLTKLISVTVAHHLHEKIAAQARQEEELLEKAVSFLSVVPNWEQVLRKRSRYASSNLVLVEHRTRTFSDQEMVISFQHPEIMENPTILYSRKEELVWNGQFWEQAEEIINTIKLLFAAITPLYDWLDQFRGRGQEWNDAKLSRVCSISPTYRACLVNNGRRSLQIEPAVITTYKHGPRSLGFNPMPPLTARALQVAACLAEVKE